MSTQTSPLVLGAIESGILSAESLAKLSDEDFELFEAQLFDELDEKCGDDPLYWAQNFTATENPKYIEMRLPFKNPFPRKTYFTPLFNAFKTDKRLMIPKTRDMLTSWSAMIWATAQAQWKHAFVIVQSMKDSKSQELIEYSACLHRNQPEWLKDKHPLEAQTLNEVTFAGGGRVLGVPMGEHQIRTFHPTIYIMDEAAFLPEAKQCWDATHAAGTPQMIAISSAGPGWFGDECSL